MRTSIWIPISAILAAVSFEPSVELQLARARANLVSIPITATSIPNQSPRHFPPVEPKPKTEELPIVYVTYAANCKPCEDFKRQDWTSKYVPFRIVPTNEPKIPAQFYPWVHWQSPSGAWIYLDGWNGKADLISRWKFNQNPPAKKTAIANPLQGNFQHYGVRGMSYAWHLRYDHGVDPSGMSQQEMSQAHDAVHAGVSSATINAWMKSRR